MDGGGAHKGSEHISEAPSGCGSDCMMPVPGAAAGLSGSEAPF